MKHNAGMNTASKPACSRKGIENRKRRPLSSPRWNALSNSDAAAAAAAGARVCHPSEMEI
jgi:hypothetical protein